MKKLKETGENFTCSGFAGLFFTSFFPDSNRQTHVSQTSLITDLFLKPMQPWQATQKRDKETKPNLRGHNGSFNMSHEQDYLNAYPWTNHASWLPGCHQCCSEQLLQKAWCYQLNKIRRPQQGDMVGDSAEQGWKGHLRRHSSLIDQPDWTIES